MYSTLDDRHNLQEGDARRVGVQLTRRITDVTVAAINAPLNFLDREYTVTGRKAKIENGQPSTTPTTATEIAEAGLSRRNKPDARDIAYIENELGKKPIYHKSLIKKNISKTKSNRMQNHEIDGTWPSFINPQR